jgi:hypothetical protein
MTSARTSASAFVVALVVAFAPTACGGGSKSTSGFLGDAVRGGTVSLGQLRGHEVLLSFLNTAAPPGSDPSRAQVVFLRSMETQHRQAGLRVVIVDAAKEATGRASSKDELVNFTYDWALPAELAVLPDDGSLARRYDVRKVPTTVLLDRNGAVARRWNGFAPAAELDLAVRGLLP